MHSVMLDMGFSAVARVCMIRYLRLSVTLDLTGGYNVDGAVYQ